LKALRRVRVLEEHPGRALVALALLSFAARLVAALAVHGPLYFRDEYLYAGLSRAIAHGSLLLRGQHVPLGSTISYLVPLITAPVWRLHDIDTAYRVDQAIGSLAFATSGFAAYALARRVGVSKTAGVFVAAMTLLVPSGVFTSMLLTEPYAYPAFVASLLVAVPAIARPSFRRALAVFGVWVGLCLTAGLQFAFFGPAWILAFIAASRSLRSAVQRTVVGVVAAGASLALLRVTGNWVLVVSFEGNVRSLHYSVGSLAAWFGATALMVGVASGWVTVPGAILGFGRLSRMNEEARALALLSVTLIVGFLAEAAVYGANSRFLYERFAFYCTPLLVIAFVAWFEHAEGSFRWPYAGVAYAAGAAAWLLPLTGTLDGVTSHSPTLAALKNLAPVHSGSGQIVWVPILGLLAIGTAWSGPTPRRALLVAALAVSGLASIGASRAMINRAAPTPTPHISIKDGAAFLTTSADDYAFMERVLFWNPAITRVLVVGGGDAPDGYGAVDVTLTANRGLAAVTGSREGGPVVVGPTTSVWASSPALRGTNGVEAVTSSPKALVFGYLRRRSYLATYATILLAGGDHGRVLTLRVWSVSGPKSIAVSCGRRTARTAVGSRPTVVRITAPAGSSKTCQVRLVAGSAGSAGGATVSVHAQISLAG
jgi:hypothetical protein